MQAEKESRAKVVLYRIKLNIILDGWISFSGSIWLTSFLGSIWLRSFLGSIRSILFLCPGARASHAFAAIVRDWDLAFSSLCSGLLQTQVLSLQSQTDPQRSIPDRRYRPGSERAELRNHDGMPAWCIPVPAALLF